jgi:outer membrane protein OmpA-like peptidoglycan-associated protein
MRVFAPQSADQQANSPKHSAGQAARRPTPIAFPSITPLADSTVQRKSGCACGGDCPSCSEDALAENIQTKLAVSTPGDHYEQEADRVADEVMRMSEPGPAGVAIGQNFHPTLQRMRESGQDEQQAVPPFEERIPRAKAVSGGPTRVTSEAQTQIDQLRGGGEPLSERARAFFEPRLGYDFSQVRIHSGGAAAESARTVNALAYTLGRDIVLGAGQASYETPGGMRLLAHELTHVVQQGGGRSLGGSAVEPVRGRVARMIQRQQTDANYEATSGVGAGITSGTMIANNSIMGQTFTAQNCRGLYGCNLNFEFGRAFIGDYPYAAAGRDVRGPYVKISASFDSSICGTCDTVHLMQTVQNITRGASGGIEPADWQEPTRNARSGWGDPAAPSRGWMVDRLVTATNPMFTSGPSGNPGTSTTPAELWDAPGDWATETNTGMEFQTCAVCENAGTQRRVIGCVNWGFLTDSAGAVNFRPATPVATCGPTQELQDATARWEAIAGNLPANIDFTRETGVDQTGQTSVLWFQQNSTTLRQDAEIDSSIHMANALRRIRQHLAVGANAGLVVHGYASEEGDPAYNMQLARRRAEAIQARLIAEGIPAGRITIQVHGASTTWPTRAYNRRVEIEHTLPPAGAGP